MGLCRNLWGLSFVLAGVAGCAAVLDPGEALPDVGDNPRALPELAEQKATCEIDEMRERVCGSLAEPVDRAAEAPFWDCPADPKQLTGARLAMLFYTDTKRLDFDRLMTLRYRDELNESCGDTSERKGECCYSRCTPLPTAAKATRKVPEGYREKVTCVDAPQTGTRYPAEGAAECPAALVFGVGPSPFEPDPFDSEATARTREGKAEFFADVGRCCYRTLERAQ